jgi:hypothetical protein
MEMFMAEQTEEKGSVILPAVIGLGAGYATKRKYDSVANELVKDAIAGAEGVKPDLVQGAKAAIGDGAVGTTKNVLDGVKVARDMGAEVSGVTVTKATEAGKGYAVKVRGANSQFATFDGVKKLSGDAKKLVGDAAEKIIEGEDVKKLVGDGKAGWVAKVADTAERDALKAVRKTAEWSKAGGGIKATLGHTSGGNRLLAGAGALVTIGGLGVATKNLFSSPHVDKIDAERAAAAGQENARV